ncbi:hypothetical protein Ndes2437A_g00528 [Nannochloris sp. 'desiccata']
MPSSPSPYQGLCSCQARMPHCRATPLMLRRFVTNHSSTFFYIADLKKVSRESFINKVRSEEGVGVVPLEEFSPEGIEEATAEEVELKDKATYIVIPRRGKSYEKRFESIETWQRNQTSGVERMLVARAIDELKKDPTHTNSTSENRCEEGQWGGYRG